MCNSIHDDYSVPRNKRGKGWKVFILRDGEYRGLVSKSYYWPTNGIIKYNSVLSWEGFCFLFTKREAERTRRIWLKCVIESEEVVVKKIEYKECISRQIEENFARPHKIDMGLCKEFRIVD